MDHDHDSSTIARSATCSYLMESDDNFGQEHHRCHWSYGDASLWHRMVTQFNVQINSFGHHKDHSILQISLFAAGEDQHSAPKFGLEQCFFPRFLVTLVSTRMHLFF